MKFEVEAGRGLAVNQSPELTPGHAERGLAVDFDHLLSAPQARSFGAGTWSNGQYIDAVGSLDPTE
ncbi:MAG TPA: hypothetical protein VGF77_13095 [Allosphingosinicella sp.]